MCQKCSGARCVYCEIARALGGQYCRICWRKLYRNKK